MGDDNQTLVGLASGGTVVLGDAASIAATDELIVTVLNAAAAGNNSDVLNIKLDDAHAAATVVYGGITAAAVETININSTSTKTTALVADDKNDLDLTAVNAVNVVITGNVFLDLGNEALTASSLNSINASANTAGVDVSVTGATQGILITGTAKADIIIGGSGADTITSGAGNDTITGGAGNDIINISGGGSNTLVFAATAAGNGKDTITGFNVGAVAGGGDVLDVSGLVTVAALTTVTSLTGATTIVDDAVIVVKFASAISGKDFGAADFADLFAAAGKAFSTTLGATAEAVIVVQGTDQSQVYFVDASATTLTDAMVANVAVLVGVTQTDDFLVANFA